MQRQRENSTVLAMPSFTANGRLFAGRLFRAEWMVGYLRLAIAECFPAPWYLKPFAFLTGQRLNPAWRTFRTLPEAEQLAVVRRLQSIQGTAIQALQQCGVHVQRH